MSAARAAAAAATVVVLLIGPLASPAVAAPALTTPTPSTPAADARTQATPTPSTENPSSLGPSTAGVCPGHEAPPPPPAREELVPGPVPAPAPLSVPAEPVGGSLLGGCGDVLGPESPTPPAVGAAGWVLADLDSGAVLAARDPHGRQRPASTLKVLTSLVVLEELDLDTVVVATDRDVQVDGSRAGIGPGGRYTVRQLLTGLLLNSGNDTANALARELGGVPSTLAAMSATAARLGALDTRPVTPSGLDGPGMASSAYDLALLFRAALRFRTGRDGPVFAELIGTRTADLPGFGGRPGFRLSNDDPLLRSYPGAIGGKTGFTDAARHTFVGAAQRDGRRLVVALVRGEQHPVPMWRQAAALLEFGFAHPGLPPVGTLVEAGPSPTAAPPAGPVRGSGSVLAPLLGGIAALAAGTALVVALRRRRR